jgi:predicted amidohydrolase YtcJ
MGHWVKAALLAYGMTHAAEAANLALQHALIYPAPYAAPIADGAILIHDGRIKAMGRSGVVKVPAGTRSIDLHGGIVTAGFWNNHVHLMSPPLLDAQKRSDAELTQELTQMLTRWGFTTVFDTASSLSNTNLLRKRIASGATARMA